LTGDCPDPHAMGDFYVALLGGVVTRRMPGETNVDAVQVWS
jgi:hypothetical protein